MSLHKLYDPAQGPQNQPAEQEAWEEDYENEKAHFLTYNKASGSRWLDDERLKKFIREQVATARAEGEQAGRDAAIKHIKEKSEPATMQLWYVQDTTLEAARTAPITKKTN